MKPRDTECEWCGTLPCICKHKQRKIDLSIIVVFRGGYKIRVLNEWAKIIKESMVSETSAKSHILCFYENPSELTLTIRVNDISCVYPSTRWERFTIPLIKFFKVSGDKI